MADETVAKILKIAERYRYSAEEMQMEANCVRDYGEWLHMPLLGYSAEALDKAAEMMRASI